MAQKIEYSLPFNNLIQYVPQNLRNTVINGLLDNLFNRFMTRDESVPLYGYVGQKPTSSEDRSPRVPQPTPERDINAIVPVLSFMVGSERVTFTVQDLINKAERVGISSDSQTWLYTQGNNFAPPIDFDRFSNFFNYYWVGNAVSSTPDMQWNPEKLPEYYVIERPAANDLTKLNCRTSSSAGEQYVLTGTGFIDQVFTLNFVSPSVFTLTANEALLGPLGAWEVSTDLADYAGSVAPTAFNVLARQVTFTLPTLPAPSGTPTPSLTSDTSVFRFIVRRAGFDPVQLVEFKITRDATFDELSRHDGYTQYETGDILEVDTIYLSQSWSVNFIGSIGLRPILGGVRAFRTYQTIGGVQVAPGDRVLIQSPASVAGIYVVTPGEWERAADFTPSTWVAGARTFITNGTNAGTLWEAQSVGPNEWGWTNVGSNTNTNDWQEANFWVSSDELNAAGVDRSKAVQATRPIIQYSSKLQLAGRVENGVPVDWTSSPDTRNFIQRRTEFNQLPLFDLFRYDGTHSGLVSSIFYYVEDLTAELDVALQRRVKRANNDSSDFVFDHGCVSNEGHLLFYKLDGALKTVWHAGYSEATVVDVQELLTKVEQSGSRSFTGTGTGVLGTVRSSAAVDAQTVTITFLTSTVFEVSGSAFGPAGTGSVGTQFVSDLASFTISGGVTPFAVGDTFTFNLVSPGTIGSISTGEFTQQQVWTVRMLTSTTFEVSGSKNVVIPSPQNQGTVGVPYTNGEISFTVSSTVGPLSPGDAFIVRIGALERPRYVQRQADGSVSDRFGGPAVDTNGDGAYQVSRTFINNPYNESRSEITEGVTSSHFRSILGNQLEGLQTDLAFGGQIKLWGEQHSLLASLLMQRDLTPISMIDLARTKYEAGLNAIRDIYIQRVVEYLSSEGVDVVSGILPTPTEEARVSRLLDWILEVRANDTDVRRVLFDTTSGVAGIPATLPQLGISPLVFPFYAFDRVLGRDIFVHHDGHSSIPFVDTEQLRQEILGSYTSKTVERSDGTSTSAIGSFTNTAPADPYKGTLWLLPSGELRAFDVDFDTASTPDASEVGSRWYQRGTGVLFVSDGTNWVAQPSAAVAWKTVNLAATLNELFFQTEVRLHNHINPNQRRFDFSAIEANPFYQEQLQRELFAFAARESLDPLAVNYNPQDAFTWNYKGASTLAFPPLSTATVPARWYNILVAHQQTVAGVIPTERPNLEPWKLLGFSTYAAWWATLSPAQQAAFVTGVTENDLDGFVNGGEVRVVATSNVSLLGLQTIDGVALNGGDTVLLTNQLSPVNNGLWTVSAGSWSRPVVGLTDRFFTVADGAARAGTAWAVTVGGIPGLDPITIKQVRPWSDALWAHVQAERPTLRLSVDVYTDELLPPYVSPSAAPAPFALTTSLPVGITQPFLFGEGSPVEEVWERSIEYGYAQAKALFRFDPCAFLGFCWGFNWVEVDGILYDGMDLSMPGHRRFAMHGDARPLGRTAQLGATSVAGAAVGTTYTVRYDAYDVNRRQNFSVRTADGTIVGFIVEGITTSVTLTDGTTVSGGVLIEDHGVPFRIGDSFNVTVTSTGFTSTFIPTTQHQILGFGQIFTNALREVSIDTQSSYAVAAFREWDVNMGYRAGGLVVTDDLKVTTETDKLSEASYDLVFKKNEGARDLWLQGLRVVLVQRGTTGANALRAGATPADRPTPNLLPGNAAEDWVFRIEGYNPNYLELQYYQLEGMPGGTSFPASPAVNARFFRHDEGQAYLWNGTAWVAIAANVQTFKALQQEVTPLSWYQPLTVTGLADARLPVTITGLQNVVNFIFGYVQRAEELGWNFQPNDAYPIDATTGRYRNWQLEVEILVDAIYRGIDLGEGHVVNPFIDRVQVRQDAGLLAPFSEAALFDIFSHAAAFDVLGNKIQPADLIVERRGQLSSVRSTVPMFSVHALIDEYEHLFIFRNSINPSDGSGTLYDPFSGGRVVTYKFNGRRQNTGTMRPELGGHYLVGDKVRLNLQASTDSLASIYDPDAAFENSVFSKHALALLGFNRKDYFTDLDITDKSQFNFWRGLIQAKGTNLSIDAYLNNDRFKEAKIDEYWAYKVAEYGDARQRTFPELRLQVDDSFQQFTLLQFDAPAGEPISGDGPGPLINFSQVSRFDEDRWFSIEDLDQDTFFKAEAIGVFSQVVAVGDVVVLPFIADAISGAGATFTQLNSTTLVATSAGTLVVTGYGPATPRFSPVKLINYVDDQVVEEIPLWHPAIGQHTPTAMEAINVISDINPARYNYSTLAVNNNSFDPLRPWGDREVGRVWFDTRNLTYVPYQDRFLFPNRSERLSRWGSIADFASIDVYEWVKSSVPPSEYNARARQDAGNADIDASVKASGEVALEQTYVRDRQWRVRPVAWSYSPVPTDIDWENNPPMKYSGNIIEAAGINFSASRAVLESGSFSALGAVAGDRIGTWQYGINPAPLTEGTINGSFALNLSGLALPATAGSFLVNMQAVAYPTSRFYGALSVSTEPAIAVAVTDPDGIVIGYDYTYYVTIANELGQEERIVAYVVRMAGTTVVPPTMPVISGQRFTYSFPLTGLEITVTYTGASRPDLPGADIAAAIVTALDGQITIKDSVGVTWLTPAPAAGFYSNDQDDWGNPAVADNVGWRIWSVPTQAQLDADGRQPVSSWRPYVGAPVAFNPTYEQLQEAIAYQEAPLTLNDSTVVERYAPTWSDWRALESTRVCVTALAAGVQTFNAVDFGVTKFDLNSTGVYVNGISQLRSAITTDGVSLSVTVGAGSVVDVVVLRYEPTEAELAFNPEVEEDFTFQRHYKKDYEYVVLEQRDSTGTVTAPAYFFWVKNKTTAAMGKKLSVQAIKQQLQVGPPNYLTFQHILPPEADKPWRYDAITLSGLSYVVTKNDTFKLRFTRNFTLRDDPNDLDLKNTHTEWSLMRPSQKSRIPEALWFKLVDSAAGSDIAGNPVPSLRRELYDERRGSRTRFGFGPEQTLAPSSLLRKSLSSMVVNTKLQLETPAGIVPDFIQFISDEVELLSITDVADPAVSAEYRQFKINQVASNFFATPELTRQTLTRIWAQASVAQINELFFAALEDILANNFELTDIFKTSRLSLFSIQEKRPQNVTTTYE